MRRQAGAWVVTPRAIVGSIAVVVLALAAAACGSSTKESHRTNIDATLRQALRDHAAGKLGTARKEYEEVLAADGSNRYARYNLGLIFQTEGDAQAATRYYRLALESDPHFEPAMFNLAIMQTEAGRTNDALSLYRQVIALDPSNAGAHLNLGLLYLQRHKVGAARAELDRAVSLNPSLRSRLPASVPPSKNPSASMTTARP